MSARRGAMRHSVPALAGLALASVLAACTTPPADPDPAGKTVGPAAAAAATTPLRPLTRQIGAPADAPRSRVASVLYDLGLGAEGDLPSGDGPSGDVFQRGGASWYGLQFHQRKTASGERFDMGAFTAAHKTLPFGTRLCVRSLVNGREVLVRVNDRGPYAAGRIIDLSHAAAEALGMIGLGIKQVTLTRVAEGGRCKGTAVNPSDGVDLAVAADRPVAKTRTSAKTVRRHR